MTWREVDHPRWPTGTPETGGAGPGRFRERSNPLGWLDRTAGALSGRMTHAQLDEYSDRADWVVVPGFTHGGNSAITTLRRYSDGRLLIHKEHNNVFDDEPYQGADNAEIRASYIGWAVGAPVPAVVAADPHDYQGATLSEYIAGDTAAAHLGIDTHSALDLRRIMADEQRMAATLRGSRELGMFDWLIGNTDRHMLNWLVTPDGAVVGIDHAEMDVYEDTSSPFAEYLRQTRIPWSRQEIEEIARKLLKLKQAKIIDGPDWQHMVGRLNRLAEKATG